MRLIRVPPYFLPAIILCCAGAFFEISFVKVAVQLASNDTDYIIPFREYIFAMCAPIAYITFYTYFYFASVKLAKSKLNEVLSMSCESGIEDVSKGHLYKIISDDFVAVIESFLFPGYLFTYRLVIVLTLAANILWMTLAEQPFLVVVVIVLFASVVFILQKAMRLLASAFSNVQNARHDAITMFVGISGDALYKTEGLVGTVSAIFPYKFIQNSMGGLVKPLVDLAMIVAVVYLVLSEPTGVLDGGIIAGIGATSWRMIGPTINLFIASGQIRYGYGQLHLLWKRALVS